MSDGLLSGCLRCHVLPGAAKRLVVSALIPCIRTCVLSSYFSKWARGDLNSGPPDFRIANFSSNYQSGAPTRLSYEPKPHHSSFTSITLPFGDSSLNTCVSNLYRFTFGCFQYPFGKPALRHTSSRNWSLFHFSSTATIGKSKPE